MLPREMSETVEGLSKHSWDTNPLFFQDEVYERMRLLGKSAPAVLSNSLQWKLGAQFMGVPELWRKQTWTSSCIYCCTVILYFIILLPWDFTSRLRSPGGNFCLNAYLISGMFPFLQHSCGFSSRVSWIFSHNILSHLRVLQHQSDLHLTSSTFPIIHCNFGDTLARLLKF